MKLLESQKQLHAKKALLGQKVSSYTQLLLECNNVLNGFFLSLYVHSRFTVSKLDNFALK